MEKSEEKWRRRLDKIGGLPAPIKRGISYPADYHIRGASIGDLGGARILSHYWNPQISNSILPSFSSFSHKHIQREQASPLTSGTLRFQAMFFHCFPFSLLSKLVKSLTKLSSSCQKLAQATHSSSFINSSQNFLSPLLRASVSHRKPKSSLSLIRNS